jgi:4-hydroxy-tetrahydrodipicolinate reductase
MNEIKVIQYGLGAMGSRIASFALDKKGLKIVGAIDIDKDKVGKDLGEVLGKEKSVGVKVTDDPEELFSTVKADIVIHSTLSYLEQSYPQIVKCVEAGLNVVSTCEELSYPYNKYPEIAQRIDSLAKENRVTLLGTGINPGYLMDTLPITLSGICLNIESVTVTRMMYSGDRRDSYQKKIGTGLDEKTFRGMIKDGKITGHVGLVESVYMLAAALGWTLDVVEEPPPEPVICEKETETTFKKIKLGEVAGLRCKAYGVKDGKNVIIMEFISHANVEDPYDSVSIEGLPRIEEKIRGGVNGDIGTVAMIINSIPKVINAQPGFMTMLDLPIPSATVEDMRTYLKWRTQPTC